MWHAIGSVNIDSIIYTSVNSLLPFLLVRLCNSYFFYPMSLSVCLVLLWTMLCPSALVGMMYFNI